MVEHQMGLPLCWIEVVVAVRDEGVLKVEERR